MLPILQVALGGAIGAALRYAVAAQFARTLGTAFPYGTLAVNVVGCLLMGLVYAWIGPKSPWAVFLMTGILGGFTTFSAFSLEIFHLSQAGQSGLALVYVLVSVVAGVLALWLGLMLGGATG